MEWLKLLGESLVLTIVLEVLMAYIIGIRKYKDLLLGCLVNVVTNPVVVLLCYLSRAVIPDKLWLTKLVLELFAFGVEGWYYKRYGSEIRKPWMTSVLLNGISYGTGCILSMM